jgi:ElaB/YqjD/DUF883 family membrane-anchored ribosome-binding protein
MFYLLLLASCSNTPVQDTPKPQPPAALADKGSFDIKSRGDDLVERLYDELSGSTPELKQFESQLEQLAKTKDDSTESFDKFNEKNQSYFNAANRHIEGIKDSVLREKTKALVYAGLTRYDSKISKHRDLLDLINKKTVSLEDLHIVLKITRTLPLLEKYQADNLPTSKPMDGYLKQLGKTLQTADTLIKK